MNCAHLPTPVRCQEAMFRGTPPTLHRYTLLPACGFTLLAARLSASCPTARQGLTKARDFSGYKGPVKGHADRTED